MEENNKEEVFLTEEDISEVIGSRKSTSERVSGNNYDEPPEIEDDEEKDLEKKMDFVQWNKRGTNSFFPESKLTLLNKVPAGVYGIKYSQVYKEYYISRRTISLDELLLLPDSVSEDIIKDMKTFWDRESWFKKYKFTYKRGILLMGSAGTGKSSLINILSHEIVKNYDGLVFTIESSHSLEYFMEFIPGYLRQIEPNRRILCIIEDLENYAHNSETETALLNLLDGLNQINNVVYLGTTNYPEHLKERILNRPSRFDRRYEIKFPSDKARRYYFENKLKAEDLKRIDLNIWVKETKNYSLAHLSEIIKSVFAFGKSFEDTIKELNQMRDKVSSFDFNKESKNGKIGFNKD